MQNFYKGQDIVKTLKRNHLRHPLNTVSAPKLPYLSPEYMYTNINIEQTTEFMSASHSSAHTERSHAYKQFLTEAVGHTRGSLFPLPYVQSIITTSKEIPHAISQHSTFTQQNYCNKGSTDTLFPKGWRELDEILCTVTGLWEERKDSFFLLLTGCFCNTALIQEENTHNPIILSIQICKDVNRCSPYMGLETDPKLTPRHFWVQKLLALSSALYLLSKVSLPPAELFNQVPINTGCHLATQLGLSPPESTCRVIWRSREVNLPPQKDTTCSLEKNRDTSRDGISVQKTLEELGFHVQCSK